MKAKNNIYGELVVFYVVLMFFLGLLFLQGEKNLYVFITLDYTLLNTLQCSKVSARQTPHCLCSADPETALMVQHQPVVK